MERQLLRTIFKYVNKFVMVPNFRLGWAAQMLNPVTGYIMVLRTVGRKTGKVRSTPLDYAILDGNVYCLAGWGNESHWYTNLKADPHVQVMMPGGSILSGIAEEVTDLQEASRAALGVVRNAGFATLFEGKNPLTLSDQEALATVADAPVIRIRPDGIVPGPHDPGGRGWVLPTLVQLAGLLWLAASLRRRRHQGNMSGSTQGLPQARLNLA